MSAKSKEILFEGELYDVSSWVSHHPGGNVIRFYSDASSPEDATSAILQFHNRSMPRVLSIMKGLKKRPLSQEELKCHVPERSQALTRDFRELFEEIKAEGLFDPSPVHIAQRISELVILIVLGLWMTSGHVQLIHKILGAIIFAVVRFRAGYLMHEGGHRSLTGNPKVDNLIQEVTSGIGGFSSSWWNSQHNRHHAAPQHLGKDVDLDTMPLLAFNQKVIEAEVKKGRGWLVNNPFVRHQKILFFLLDTILVGILFSLVRSPRYAFKKGKYLQLFCMALSSVALPLHMGVIWFGLSAWIASLNLFGNFSLNHTHLPVTSSEHQLNWVEYSLLHTANVEPSRFLNWWMGHLDFQIEHHLFPTLPQFRCALIAPRVRALAKKHGIPYLSNGYWDAFKKVVDNLGHVAEDIKLLKN